jgi:hypothetical protein
MTQHLQRADRPIPRQDYLTLPLSELFPRFSEGTTHLDKRLLELSDDQLDTTFHHLPEPERESLGGWSCRQLVGHLADAEIAIVFRMRRTAAEEGPVLQSWDADAFVDQGLYARADAPSRPPVAGSVAVIHTLRMWSGDWLKALPETAWARQSLHPAIGPMKLIEHLAHDVWHLEHHAWFLSSKLDRLFETSD